MRIIDADILLKNLEWLDEYDYYVLHSVKISMDKTPTVKAIPVEWVEKWVDILKERNYHSYQVLMPVLIEMLKEWEKENDSNDTIRV